MKNSIPAAFLIILGTNKEPAQFSLKQADYRRTFHSCSMV